MDQNEELTALYDYAAGNAGTRETIARLGMSDFGDLLAAMSTHDLAMPKPRETPVLAQHRERARAILMPLLRNGG